MNGEPFVLGGGEVGALLVHGFTSTPFEVRFLGERLAAAGITTVGPLLPGHGTTVADLGRTAWPMWAAAVEAELDRLRERCRRVVVAGVSLGALLALELASRRGADIAGVCALAAPLWLTGLGAEVARWTAPGAPLACVRTVPKLGGSDVADPEVERANPAYRAIPTRALAELVAVMRAADAALPAIPVPVLALHGAQDHTAPVGGSERIVARVPRGRMQLFPRSYHLLAADVERADVADAVIRFIEEL